MDTLFFENPSVLVISITYNTGSNLDPNVELMSKETALRYFWLRVLKSLLQSGEPLKNLDRIYQDCDLSLSNFVQICEEMYVTNPFLQGGKRKDVLICVDEFSLLTDKMCECFGESDTEWMTTQLHCQKMLSPFVQFVFTGFKTNMGLVFGKSCNTVIESLTMCDNSESRPLLREIVKRYENAGYAVPSLLLQSIKSSPGLLGQWAEFVTQNRFDRNVIHFASGITWLAKLIEADSNLILELWTLTKDYLCFIEMDRNAEAISMDISKRLDKAQVAGSQLRPKESLMLPICLILIAFVSFTNAMVPAQDRQLLTNLTNLFQAIDRTDASKKDEASLENFLLHTLMIRFELHRCNKLRLTWTT